MRRTLLLSYLLLVSILISAQQGITPSKLSPYTSNFITNLKESSKSSNERKALFKSVNIQQINTQECVSVFIYLADNANLASIEKNGAKINTQLKGIVTAIIPVDKLEAVAALPDVKYLQMGTPISKRMNKARVTSNVEKVQNGLAPLNTPFYGKDVVVGIIDCGFEYGHPNFYNANQTALRIKRVWEQRSNYGTSPSAFNYGSEYKTESAILAAQTDTENETHGTHVAGIAAGGDRTNGNTYYGIAGDADIVLVSYGNSDASIPDAIKYIYDYAETVGKPCVINMSLGTHIGPHDGTSALDEVADQLQGKGRLLVGSAGNEGKRTIHASKTFSKTDSELKSFFQLNENKKIICDIWGEARKNYTVQLIAYNTSTKKIIYKGETSNFSRTERLTSEMGNGKVSISAQTNSRNKKLNIYITSQITSINEDVSLGIIIRATEGTVNAWAHDSYCNFTNLGLIDYYSGDSESTNGEIGGTGKQIITVGAYTSNKYFTNLSGSIYGTYEIADNICSFSSKGPTADGRMKPEITAPGSIIVSSISSYDNTYNASNKVKKTTFNGKNYYYGTMSGTSMASPYVTGVLATWLQANPNLTPENVKAIFSKTAINDFYTTNLIPFGNNTWGQGKIDAFTGICKVLDIYKKSTSINELLENSHPIVIYPAAENSTQINVLFTTSDKNVQIDVFNMNGQKVINKQLNEVSSKQEYSIDLEGVTKGVYIIKVSGNKLNQIAKVVR